MLIVIAVVYSLLINWLLIYIIGLSFMGHVPAPSLLAAIPLIVLGALLQLPSLIVAMIIFLKNKNLGNFWWFFFLAPGLVLSGVIAVVPFPFVKALFGPP
jgi:hypothetical protein